MKWMEALAVLMILPSILCDEVLKLDIAPEEAQKLITSQSLDVIYAPKIGEQPVPVKKDDNGNLIYQGRKISNPSDYVEEEYLAKQFHGQDGLGRALFGYSDWNQGRVEALNANGDVRGTYKYVDPEGKDVVVNYWSDSLGFHQEDNRPKVVLHPVTDTPEVQAAREEHFRKWREAAEAAKANPDPLSDVYNRNANKYDEAQAQIDQANEIIRGSPSEQQPNRVQPREWKYEPTEEEATGEPRGFFYKFEYPVQLLKNIKETDEVQRLRRTAEKAALNNHEKQSEESKESDESDETVPVESTTIQSYRFLSDTK